MSQFNIDEIEKRTLSGLKDFQRATVERVDYLFRHNQNRVLVADEVGMGKTLIARGAIVKTARLRIEEKDDLFKVIYICSNQNIANQNIRKLDVTGKNAIGSVSDTRLSMHHLKITEQENDPQIKEGFIQLELFSKGCGFTDDSVMTIAVGVALLSVGPKAAVKEIEEAIASNMQDWGKRYPHAGYGGSFRHWLKENNPKPYGSYGNGSAMRVSAAGWLYDSIERTREVARATANVTHNHPEGIKGAEATASAIYMARNGSSKEEIKEYIEREFHYNLDRTLDEIRPEYHMDETCQRTVPEAIIAFLESKDFEDAVRNAVSLGGDTDTLGAITGSIAEAFYEIPAVLIAECKSRIDKGLMTDVLDEFDHVLGRSVDTYSDEMGEIQANQMIEAAINQYYIQQDKNGMLLFMEVMVTRMQQAGEVVVPYITENPFMSEEQVSKVKAGDTISLDHDVRIKIETVKDADEKEWIGVFTSSEEMHKGSAGNVQMNQSIESILRLALNWKQVNGIVINPFGKYIQMTKKMIELLINGYEYYENERKSKDDENN